MKVYKILSIILFIVGLFLIEPKTTGAVIGFSILTLSSTIGIFLILISGILFIAKEENLEENIGKLWKEFKFIVSESYQYYSSAKKSLERHIKKLKRHEEEEERRYKGRIQKIKESYVEIHGHPRKL